MKYFSFLFFLFLGIGNYPIVNGQNAITLDSTELTEREVAIGLSVPWEILWGPDDYLWVTERQGRVLHIHPESGNINEVLDIKEEVFENAEPGLLGMALHPDFENEPYVYLAYTYLEGFFNIRERLVRYEWNGTILENEMILLDDIDGGGIHNGSRLLITPDHKLLMTTGDVGSGNNSQNMNNLNGKLLRINLDGSIPEDNPIPDSYIYSYGHRNAQGLAYGPNGQLYSSEHGAQSSDEFNIIYENRNYGWPNVEGICNTTPEINFCEAFNVVEPLIEWTPCVAVNDLIYYDHEAIPEWKGKMLMAVLGGFVKESRISVLEFNEDGTAVISEKEYFTDYGRLRDICINPYNGAIYFATNGGSYPSSGPNRIIEYRNRDFVTSVEPSIPVSDQFVKILLNPPDKALGLNINFSDSFLNGSFQLIAYDGRIMHTQKISSTSENVDIDHFPPGNYYVKALGTKGMITRKFVLQ